MNKIKKSNKYVSYFKIADITIKVSSELPITESTFHPKFKLFKAERPGKDMISIHHYFAFPELKKHNLGKMVYNKPPWKIYKKDNQWTYIGTYPNTEEDRIFKIAYFNNDHTRGQIFNESDDLFKSGIRTSLTLFASDQILLARILPDRNGCIIHSSGLVYKDSGLVFVGHSEAGKSTIVKIFKNKAEILCDDRVIIRRKPDNFYVYGTWSHGEVSDVSAGKGKLKALFFLKKSKENKIEPLENKKEITTNILDCIVKPLVTSDWWDKIITLAYNISREIPCYNLHFNKKGGVVELIDELLSRS